MRSSGRLICWIVLLTTCVSTISAGSVSARVEQTNRAGLVVQFGDGSVFTSCVEFTEPDISAYDVLVRAGLTVEASFDALMGPASARSTVRGARPATASVNARAFRVSTGSTIT